MRAWLARLSAAVLSLSCLFSVAGAETAPAPADGSAEPGVATPGPSFEVDKIVELVCTTEAVEVADQAKISRGELRLRLLPKAEAGSWSVISVEATHSASFAAVQRDTCQNGCPLDLADRGAMLWAPQKTMPAAIAKGQVLSLAAFETKTMEIRVSIYRDSQISSLEKGTCKVTP